MTNQNINISNIEDFFHRLLYGENKLTMHLFFNMPKIIQSEWGSFVVVDLSSVIKDMGGCGKGMIPVFSYANSRSDGGKDSSTLSAMDNKLNELILNSKDEHYFISRYETYSDYDSDRNLHCNITLINLQIV